MTRPSPPHSLPAHPVALHWEPGTVVELPLLVTGQTAGHLEYLANQKGMTLGSFIRSLLDESLARGQSGESPARSGPGLMASTWPGDCPAE